MSGFFFTVPQSHCVIIERLGKFSRVAEAGWHFRIPLLESVRTLTEWDGHATKRGGRFIELTEQQTDTPARATHTRDNVAVTADASVYWRIVNPQRAVYEVDVLPRSITDTALNALRACIGELELDQVLSERQSLNDRISAQLSNVASRWGIQIARVEIQSLSTSDETAAAMRQQMEAERARRALVATSEGEAEAKLKVAEASRKAAVLEADGRAKATQMTADAEEAYLHKLKSVVGDKGAVQLLLAEKMISGFEKISASPASKVYLPNSVQGIMMGDDAGLSG